MSENSEPEPVSFSDFCNKSKYDIVRFALGLATIVSFALYFLRRNEMIYNSGVWYNRCFLIYAASCAIRLHQRVQTVQLSFEYLQLLAREDSFHYLTYCISIRNLGANLSFIIPVVLFATYQNLAFFHKFLNEYLKKSTDPNAVKVCDFFQRYSTAGVARVMLTLIAVLEVSNIFYVIYLAFRLKASLFFVFLYVNFIRMRANSSRNGATRNLLLKGRTEMSKIRARVPILGIPINLIDKVMVFLLTSH
ncbi:Transmembrane protein 33 [Thelohanellus kitauei]|uniref:Transmembrane protein 33 n=1 Tax=Thelohanellus kitauei TaxID=669202 RepID=A0A0C2NIE1_THEKT|nr:Transmembrane protein 33 [Thelohanellus kitauei]